MSNSPSVVIRTCPLYWETLTKYQRYLPKIKEFLKFKADTPFANFGSRDAGAHHNFADLKVRHAHVSSDISIWYRIHGRNPTYIDLYGLFSHDESGTGQPANMRKQKNLVTRMTNTKFTPTAVSEAEQILTADTQQNIWQWLTQSLGKNPHMRLRDMVNIASKPSNTLALLSHLRETIPQLERLSNNLPMIWDPDLQDELEQSVQKLKDLMHKTFQQVWTLAQQGNEAAVRELHAQYQSQTQPILHSLMTSLRAVFKTS